MTTVSIGLVFAYSVTSALLLALCLSDRLSRALKIFAVISVTGLYFVTWQGYQDSLGWPTKQAMPDNFRVLWITVEEPDKAQKEPGSIAFWVRSLDEAGLAYGVPRAHSIPWSEEAAEAAQEALENLEEGELLNGRMSRDLAPQTDQKEGEAQDYAAGESPQSEDGMIPSFEFFKVPPPSLPAKSV